MSLGEMARGGWGTYLLELLTYLGSLWNTRSQTFPDEAVKAGYEGGGLPWCFVLAGMERRADDMQRTNLPSRRDKRMQDTAFFFFFWQNTPNNIQQGRAGTGFSNPLRETELNNTVVNGVRCGAT